MAKSPAQPKTKKPRGTSKYRPIMVVRMYRYVKAGLTDKDICKEFGISAETLWQWQRAYPELKEAEDMARKELADTETFPDWVYARLSPELQALWKKIEVWHKQANGIARIEAVLQDNGLRVRQQLFLHALCLCRFSPSAALQKVNVTKKELERWVTSDPDFAELVEEIQWHKGNFFEEMLVQLVAEHNPQAVLFANKTFNRDRGYMPQSRSEVDVSGKVLVGVLDLSELMPYMTDEVRLAVLDAIRKREEAKSLETNRALTPEEMLRRRIAEEVP